MGAVKPALKILPALAGGITPLGVATAALGVLDAKRQSDERSQRQRLSQQQAEQGINIQRQQNALSSAQAESDRLDSLRHAVARQRAQFGSRGIGSSDGSSEAILLGLFDQSEDEKQKREQLDALRDQALDNKEQKSFLNLLDATRRSSEQTLRDLYSSAGDLDLYDS